MKVTVAKRPGQLREEVIKKVEARIPDGKPSRLTNPAKIRVKPGKVRLRRTLP